MKYQEDLEQDWEPVIMTSKKDSLPSIDAKVEFHKLLVAARTRANFTRHKLCQALNIKLSELEIYEDGKEIPSKKIITKMNKVLSCKLPIQ